MAMYLLKLFCYCYDCYCLSLAFSINFARNVNDHIVGVGFSATHSTFNIPRIVFTVRWRFIMNWFIGNGMLIYHDMINENILFAI